MWVSANCLFPPGTRLRFHKGPNVEWQEAEDVLESDEDSDDEGETRSNPMKVIMHTVIIQVCTEKSYCQSNLCLFVSQSYGSDGLKLVVFEESVSFGQSVLKLTFDPGSPEAGLLTAECRLDHPFFVKNKGKCRSHVSMHNH